jgi:type II secretory pathway pseudopilin PulG
MVKQAEKTMVKTSATNASWNPQSGYTYVGVLFIIATIGLTLSLASTLWSFAQQREKERELLFVGNQFRKAIQQYYVKTPGFVKTFPPNLEALLEDNRFVTTQRYLRKIYLDPMTNTAEWGLINSPQGGIMGVYSMSDDKPIKQDGFAEVNNQLANRKHYSEWQFFYFPQPVAVQN